MAGYAGDLVLGDTIDIKFCTVQSTGAPFTLGGVPVISAYVGNNTTEITAGITLTVDFDTRTGFNNVRVVASSGNGFAAATNVSLVITTGTVNGVSVVGYEVGSFSIQNRGISSINGIAATSVTTISAVLGTSSANTPQTGDSYARLGAPAGASVSADVAAVKVDTAAVKVKTDFLPSATAGAAGGVFIAGTNAATTVTTSFTTTFTGNLTGSVASVTGAVGSVTGAVGSVTGAVGSVTGNVGGNVVGSVASVTAGVTVTTNNDKTGYALSATGSAALTESYAADGAAATLPQLLYMTLAMLSEFSISGTTLTAKKLDGSTTAGTFTLSDATNPTSITRAT